MMEFGSVYVDCKGLNLLAESAQTIEGLYNRVKSVMSTNKMIVACNAMWGDTPITPINVFAIDMGDDGVYCTASTLQIRVSTDDSVSIYNMAPENV